MTDADEIRAGEVPLDFDPADRAQAGVTFIGHIRSDWSKGNAPRNISQARQKAANGASACHGRRG